MAERRNAAVGMTQSPYGQNPRMAGQGMGAPGRYPSAPRGGYPYGAPSGRSGKNAPQPQKGKKRSRRERDYFFVMRKGVCFLMLLVSLLMIGVLALSFLNIAPEVTAMYVKPDLTPDDQRLPTKLDEPDEDNNTEIDYEDKSEYIGISDPIYGLIAGFTGGSDEDVTAEAAENEDETNPATPAEGGEGKGDEAEEEKPKSPFYDDIEGQLEAMLGDEATEAQQEDGMLQIAGYIFKYGPIAFAVTAVLALLVALKALFGMFGRRIFRGFGISAILMVICGLVTVVMGLIASGVIQGNPSYTDDGTLVSVMDFGGIMDFITQTFATFPATAADLETEVFLTFKLGYGSLIMVVLPVVLLILSFFAKRKVPYSIFDR